MDTCSMLKINRSSSFKKSRLAASVAIAVGSALTFNVAVAADEASTNDEKKGYEKIVVTGQKITRTLQETPASIAVFSTDKIEQQNIGDFSEVLFETANVHGTTTGGFSIRGIDGFSVSGAGNSSLASVYIDGAAMPQRAISNGFSTWDISQIEVLRGPQSTLQGRNSLAGAVILTTQAPTQEFTGKYRVEIGENGQKEYAIAVGGGLIDNELAFRFSAEKEDFDGVNYNVIRNENSDFRNDELYRLKLLYTPQSIPELSMQLSATHSKTLVGNSGVAALEDGGEFDQRFRYNNDPQQTTVNSDITNLEVKYEINDVWQFLSLSTYSFTSRYFNDFDADGTAVNSGTRNFDETIKTVSQEFRLTFNDDKLSGVIGAYYFDQENPSEAIGLTRIDIASAGITAANVQGLAAQSGINIDLATAAFAVSLYDDFNPARLQNSSTAFSNVTTHAIFSDVTYEINEQWDIFGGIRWDKEKQLNDNVQSFTLENIDDLPIPELTGALAPLVTGINASILGQVGNANGELPIADADFEEFIPKLGVSYRWNDDITNSFSIQQGYRSGGVGVNQAEAEPYQFGAELTTNYEFSFRSFWLDGDLMLNANAFYIDWKDQQVLVQLSDNDFDTEIQNAGKSTIKGFELETYYQVSDNLELSASLGQAKSEFTDFLIVVPSASGDIEYDLSGRSFADAPEWTSNFTATYTTDNGFFANISANYASSSKSDNNPFTTFDISQEEIDSIDNSRDLTNFDPSNDARTLVNVKIGYDWDNVGIYLIGKNIFDKQYYTNPLRIESIDSEPGGTIVSLGDERQMSISLRGSF